ncbi:unnamed protein product [Caenorhabditis auriculariae]|uniref:Uncharacterized protein n=1 Tax=Caenorhabditis auriculariae TaxID=2777116 RepID=A0A8S1GM27_9PELO|nr:unnamed protein product [Caenorhabditis auriculariae]
MFIRRNRARGRNHRLRGRCQVRLLQATVGRSSDKVTDGAQYYIGPTNTVLAEKYARSPAGDDDDSRSPPMNVKTGRRFVSTHSSESHTDIIMLVWTVSRAAIGSRDLQQKRRFKIFLP